MKDRSFGKYNSYIYIYICVSDQLSIQGYLVMPRRTRWHEERLELTQERCPEICRPSRLADIGPCCYDNFVRLSNNSILQPETLIHWRTLDSLDTPSSIHHIILFIFFHKVVKSTVARIRQELAQTKQALLGTEGPLVCKVTRSQDLSSGTRSDALAADSACRSSPSSSRALAAPVPAFGSNTVETLGNIFLQVRHSLEDHNYGKSWKCG